MDEETGFPLSDDDTLAAFSVPSFYADRFMVHAVPGVRIAFGENIGGTGAAKMHTAIKLSAEDAIALYKLIQKVVSPYEEEIAKQKERENG